jgi:DNA-binding MarR family transcriptional regulator
MSSARPSESTAASSGEAIGISLYGVLVRLSRALRSHTPDGELTLMQLSTLSVVGLCGPTRLGDLAARLGIAPPTTSRMIENLVERGLVSRNPDPDDQRATLVGLTAFGEATVAKLREQGTGYLGKRLDALDPDQLRALIAALPVLEEIAANEVPAPAIA